MGGAQTPSLRSVPGVRRAVHGSEDLRGRGELTWGRRAGKPGHVGGSGGERTGRRQGVRRKRGMEARRVGHQQDLRAHPESRREARVSTARAEGGGLLETVALSRVIWLVCGQQVGC